MLTVSLVGKKFSCSIQLQKMDLFRLASERKALGSHYGFDRPITPEKEGGGLELALKAGEKCSNRPQSISNVTASLNISIQRGCSNYVTKCKEMLMFLQEQALPKTMNIMKVHMVNRETKNLQRDESKLFSCITPAKRDRERTRDRSCSRDRLSTRGYCSDSEQVYRHSYAGSTESLTSRTSSKTDILATPRPTRHQLKNAAILRERRQRDASRDRNEMKADKEGLSKHHNRSSSIEIQLPTRESRRNKPKRYSLGLETDVESQGNVLTYDGGSESSLRGGIKETGQKENKMNLIGKSDNEQGVVVGELDGIDTVKDPQTNESDMSADSLECLDTTSEDIIKTTIRKKKKWTMKKEKSSTEDIRSNPSVVSIIPALALPEDLYDSPIDYPSDSQLHSDADISHSKRRSISSRGDHDGQTLAAREIVDKVICSALRKCTESKNTTSYGVEHVEAAVQSNGVIDDDVENENRSQSKEKHEGELHGTSKVQTEGFASDVTMVTDAINVATQTDQLSGQASVKHTLNNVIANSEESERQDVITSYRQTSGRLDDTMNSQHNERGAGNGTLKDARSNPLVKLYDTHENITTRIIHSVSLALRLQESYTASQGASLAFDPRAPCYSVPVELDLRGGMHLTQQQTNYFHEEDLQEKKSEATATPRGFGTEGYRNNCGRTRQRKKREHGSLIAEFCKGLPVRTTYIPNDDNIGKNSGYCYFVIGPDSQQSSNIREAPTTNDTHPMIEEPKYAERMRNGKQFKTRMYRRSLYDQNERRRWHASNEIGDVDPVRYSSQETKSARANRCVSCPVLSEEDIVLEGLESHHRDVCNSLSQRTWVVLRVHEIWKAKKPLQALTTCMDLTGTKTGALLSSSSTPDLTKDNALFLNILQQLPSSCTAWSLSMCDLLLPELKLLISKRIHTSHVDMACNVLQVIVKKVSGVVLRVQTGNQEKPDILKNCIINLREVSQRVSEVLVARRGKAQGNVATEDPIALKPVLRDLSSSIQMLMDVYED